MQRGPSVLRQLIQSRREITAAGGTAPVTRDDTERMLRSDSAGVVEESYHLLGLSVNYQYAIF